MKNEIYIDDAKYKIVDAFAGIIAGTVKFTKDCESLWLTLLEVDGIPSFYINKVDLFDRFTAEDENDVRFNEYLNTKFLAEWGDDFEIFNDYESLIDELEDHKDCIDTKLFKYLCAIVRNETKDVDELIEKSIGKSLDEIEIPEIDY